MYEIVNVQYTGTYNNGGTNIPAVLGEFRATTAADLPAQNVDCHIICGCDGLDIATGDKYIWDGSGWIRQPSDRAFSNVYTKAETDALLLPITQELQAAQDIIADMLDNGSKNRMKLTGSDVSGYGINCTFDAAAGTIHLDGFNADKKCTGSFNIQCSATLNSPFVEGTVYHFTCDGYPTSNDDIGIYVYTSGATPNSQFDCFTNNVLPWNDAWKQASGFRLFIRQGTVVDNVTLRPMICTERDYQISSGFVPYCPTLQEMYALIRSYHP